MTSPSPKMFGDYHTIDLLLFVDSFGSISHLDTEEMQELIKELASRLEDCYERSVSNSI